MANHYLEFSQVVRQLTPEEIAWLERELVWIDVFGDQEFAEGETPLDRKGAAPDWSGYRFLRGYLGDEDEGQEVGFLHQFTQEEETSSDRELWVHSDESADLGKLSHLIQRFLRTFRPQTCWSLTYAATCSKPRVGEFGGGALFVSARTIKFYSIWDWNDAQEAAFAKRFPARRRRSKSRRK